VRGLPLIAAAAVLFTATGAAVATAAPGKHGKTRGATPTPRHHAGVAPSSETSKRAEHARPGPAGAAAATKAAAGKPAPRGGSSGGGGGGGSADNVPAPPDDEREGGRVRRLQETIGEILHSRTLGRLRVGLRVLSARSGRVFYGRHEDALMDPASNEKVLATTAALMRLGADWRYRTELGGPAPDEDGVITGNIYLRGSGDPSLRLGDLEQLAARLRARGVTRVDGAVVADPRRIGDDEAASEDEEHDGRAPLIVDRGMIIVRVRPHETPGLPPLVLTEPLPQSSSDAAGPGFVLHNQAVVKPNGRTRIAVRLGMCSTPAAASACRRHSRSCGPPTSMSSRAK